MADVVNVRTWILQIEWKIQNEKNMEAKSNCKKMEGEPGLSLIQLERSNKSRLMTSRARTIKESEVSNAKRTDEGKRHGNDVRDSASLQSDNRLEGVFTCKAKTC
jgi:hypothetical protein